MNYFFQILSLLLFLPFITDGTSLQDAVANKTVTVEFLSNGGHRGHCLQMIIENKKSNTNRIQVEPGTYLENDDKTRQDIIIVDNQFFVLQPKEKRTILLNGLCCKSKRASPLKGKPFSIRKKTSPDIQKLSMLLIELDEFQYAGQSAMWNLVDKGDPNQIVGADSVKTMKLRQFIGQALNKEVKPFIWTQYNRPATIVSNELSLKTEGNHFIRGVKENDLIECAVYDEANQAISAIKSENVLANRWNKHNVRWNFSLEHLNPSKKFYLRISVNGVIKKEWMYYFWG